MNISVVRAVPLPKSLSLRPEFAFQLPGGFWYLVDDDCQTVIEPVLLYLAKRFITLGSGTKLGAKKTHRAAVYDLVDFWTYLAERNAALVKSARQIKWTDVDTEFVCAYRDNRLRKVSCQTHETLKAGTVRRRLNNVFDFYRSAAKRGWFEYSQIDETRVHSIPREIASDSLAHVHSSSSYKVIENAMMPADDKSRLNVVKVINVTDEWPALKNELGPLPSEASTNNDPRPCRTRLASELSFTGGLRVDEVSKLTTLQILNLYIPSGAEPFDTVSMWVDKTKFLKGRNVHVPVYLIRELLNYIDHEREACVKAGAKFGLKRHNTLFLNSLNSHQHMGKPVHPDTLDRDFNSALKRAGLIRLAEKKDPDSGEVYVTRLPKYVWHCLRHTFAKLRYKGLQAAGNHSPWLELSKELGHKDIKTTMNTYLTVLDDERRAVNAKTFAATRMLHGN